MTRSFRTRIASLPLFPRETSVGALRAGKDHFCFPWRSGSGWQQAHLDVLMSHELHTGASVLSTTPIEPVQRGRTYLERVQQDADLTRLFGGAAIPLTLLAQRTRAATTDAGCIDHAQAAISFAASFMRH